PGIEAVTGVRVNRFRFEGSERDVVAIDPAGAGAVIDIDLQAGAVADLDRDSILLHEDPAGDLGVTVGDQVTVEVAAGGPVRLTVAGVYADASYAGNYLISLDRYEAEYPTSDLDLYAFAKAEDGADLAAVRAGIEEVVPDFPHVVLDDRAAF